MRRLALCFLLLASGASADDLPNGVGTFHDDKRGATCWHIQSTRGVAITCIPDSQLKADERSQTDNQTPTPAQAPAQRRAKERYSL